MQVNKRVNLQKRRKGRFSQDARAPHTSLVAPGSGYHFPASHAKQVTPSVVNSPAEQGQTWSAGQSVQLEAPDADHLPASPSVHCSSTKEEVEWRVQFNERANLRNGKKGAFQSRCARATHLARRPARGPLSRLTRGTSGAVDRKFASSTRTGATHKPRVAAASMLPRANTAAVDKIVCGTVVETRSSCCGAFIACGRGSGR